MTTASLPADKLQIRFNMNLAMLPLPDLRMLALVIVVLMLQPANMADAQPTLRELSAKHDAAWTKTFGTTRWRECRVGIVVVKKQGMLYVLRQDTRRDTVARFRVCGVNATPGFKSRQGDGLTPEGIYRITHVNPRSQDHITMKLDYPNAVDAARHGRLQRAKGTSWKQGGGIAIHGKCSSVGCIALTNADMEVLYSLIGDLKQGTVNIPVLVLPYDNETKYEEMSATAAAQYRQTGDPYRRMLVGHLGNMRALWQYLRDSGRIPPRAVSASGLYLLPDAAR